MGYYEIMYVHLATIVPCFIIGTVVLFLKKGTALHRQLGRIYMILMFFTAFITLFMPAHVGVRLFNHFGWLHLLSLYTMYVVPSAYLSAKRGNIRAHKIKMISLYIGAILIAGLFTFVPGRYLHSVFFG